MQNGLFRVAAWLIALLLVVVLAGVIGWTLRSQPTTLALPAPGAAAAVNPPATASATATAPPTVAPAAGPGAAAAVATTLPAEPPTELPTELPTEPPTEAPTEPPTEAPTEPPTEAPTAPPTESPTESPTAPPTMFPAEEPAPTATAATLTPTADAEAASTPRATATRTRAPTDTPSLGATIPLTLPAEGETPAARGTAALTEVEIVELPVPTPTPPLATGDWTAFTDPNAMYQLTSISNTLWIATAGGALAWTKGSTTPVVYTAADGLYGNELTAVTNCALEDFGVVFGGPAGLQIGDPQTGRWRQLNSSAGGMSFDDVTTVYCDAENEFLIVGYAAYGIDIYDAAADEWRHLDRNSGLAANDVHALAVVGDREEIWVASNEGVTVSAGSDSAFYDAANSDLAADRVNSLATDAGGAVWLGAEGALYRVAGEDWTAYTIESVDGDFPRGAITALAFAPDGALWLGASGEAGAVEVCRFDTRAGICTDFFRDARGMAAGPLTSLTVEDNGDVYYTTDGNGYAVYAGDGWRTQALRRPSLLGNRVTALTHDADGSLWAATEAGVQRLVGELPALFPADAIGIAPGAVATLHAAPTGGVWVGGAVPGEDGPQAAAAGFDGSGWELLTADDGLAGALVQAIAVDPEGRTWFGSDAGISVWNGSSFFLIDRARGLPSDDIQALAADAEGVWIGAAGGGLYRFAGSQLQLLNRENVGLPSDTITQLALGPDGALWIGSDAGLARLAGGELTVIEELGERAVTSLAVTAGGEVWAGVGDEGIFYGDGRRWTQLTLADRLPAQHVTAIVAAPPGGGNTGDDLGDDLGDDPGSTVWLGGQTGGIMRFQE